MKRFLILLLLAAGCAHPDDGVVTSNEHYTAPIDAIPRTIDLRCHDPLYRIDVATYGDTKRITCVHRVDGGIE